MPPLSMTGARPRAWVLGLLLPAGMLVVDWRGYAPFGPLRWTVVLVLTVIGIAAVLWNGVSVSRRILAAWAVFLAWVVLCAALGQDPLYAWIGTAERHFGAMTWLLCGLMFVAGHALDDDGDARLVTGLAVWATGLAGAWAVAEQGGWQPVHLVDSSRIVGSLGSAAYLGAAMALAMPLCAGVALDPTWSRAGRIGAAAATALSGAALIASGARAAWVGVVAAAVVFAVVRRRDVMKVAARRRIVSTGVVACAVVFVIVVGALAGVGGRLGSVLNDNGEGGASRIDEWHLAADVLRAHLLVGVGPEGYRVAFPNVVTASYVEKYGTTTVSDRAHDGLLDVAVTTGLPGLAIYLAVLMLCGLAVARALRAEPWVCGVAVGVVAYAVQELFLFPVAELEPALWLLVGMLVVRTSPSARVTLRAPRPATMAVVGLAVAAAYFGGRDVLADHDTKAALADLARGDIPRAQAAASRAVALRGDQIDYRLAAARADAATNDDGGIGRAVGQVDAALRTSSLDPVVRQEKAALLVQRAQVSPTPAHTAAALSYVEQLPRVDPTTQLQLGVLLVLRGDERGAEAAWLTAARLAPRDAAPRTDLAGLYATEGRWAAAATQARQVLALDPSDGRAAEVLAESVGKHGT